MFLEYIYKPLINCKYLLTEQTLFLIDYLYTKSIILTSKMSSRTLDRADEGFIFDNFLLFIEETEAFEVSRFEI